MVGGIIHAGLALGSLALAVASDVFQPPMELIDWAEDRFMSCIFCMNYDDHNRVNIYGCSVARPPSCYGNVCYMRQHKNPYYYLYTSGCLNMTRRQVHRLSTRLKKVKPERGGKGNETQLCEVTAETNACICTNRANCNNISTAEPFTEYTTKFLQHVDFDELAHMRHFAPNDPVLLEISLFRDTRKKAGFNAASFADYIWMTHGLVTIMLNLSFVYC